MKRPGNAIEHMLVAVAALAVWEGCVRLFSISPLVMPGPLAVTHALWVGLAAGVFLEHAGHTLYATLLGFALGSLLGFALGIVISQVPVFERLFYPYVVAFQTVPKVAIAPLLVIWFGFGISSKVVMSLMIAFFPVVVNTIEGIRSANADQIMLIRSYTGSRWKVFRMVQLPSALPFIFAGLDIAIVLSVIGTIVGEFVGSSAGLGYLLLRFNTYVDIPGVFATLIVLSLLGVVLHQALQLAQRRIVFWARPKTTIGA